MRSTLTGLALLLAGCHAVNPPQTPQYDRRGQQIVFVADPENKHETKDHGAMATYVNNIPYVFYNPDWFASMPEEVQTFFFQHEVAHFRLKHLDSWHAITSERKRMRLEMQADCHSLLYLQNRLHYTPDQFETIFGFASLYLEEYRTSNFGNCLK